MAERPNNFTIRSPVHGVGTVEDFSVAKCDLKILKVPDRLDYHDRLTLEVVVKASVTQRLLACYPIAY